jgi:periplasmic copper chaperone A
VIRRTPLALALALAVVALVLLAAPAAAHVEVAPGQARGGSTTTLTLRFRHGLDGSATTGLEVELPEGAEVVEVPPVEGWSSAVSLDGSVVTWSAGSVPDGTEAAFPLVVRLPDGAGPALFPTIQATEAGELRWISEEEEEGEDESARPAPRLELTPAPAATPTDARAPGSTRDLPRTALEAEQRDQGGGSVAPWFIGSGIAAAVAIAVGGTLLRRRNG